MARVHAARQGLWFGWPGASSEAIGEHLPGVDDRLRSRGLMPVHLSAAEEAAFYGGMSTSVLWPLLHSLLDKIPLTTEDWDTYVRVNRRFAEAAAAAWRPGDTVWIHDYHLFLAPGMLRELVPGARIGFFLHVPFPSPDVFGVLAWRREVLEGMLGADLLGVQTHAHLRLLAGAFRRFLGKSVALEQLAAGPRTVRLGVYPIGVEPARFAAAASSPEMAEVEARIRRGGEGAILLGVDRLDYTKGLSRRLLSYEKLLERHSELHGRVRLIQLAVPSRTQVAAYQQVRLQVDQLVGQINGRFGRPPWTPVEYVRRHVSFVDLVALYRVAHVMLVTPVRDGMNLVAKEFIASRTDGDGVLLLSEFAGAAGELAGAVTVNPYDTAGTADVLYQVLGMPEAERRRRMATMRAQVVAHDVHRWADAFLHDLEDAAAAPGPPTAPPRDVLRLAREAPVLRLLLDYDGSLVPFTDRPDAARPDPPLRALLVRLARRSGTEVHLVSGRARREMESWFGDLPVGLHAEHGLWSRLRPTDHWHRAPVPETGWRHPIRRILDRFVESTPGSSIEEKEFSLAWHWRRVEPELGRARAAELLMHLSDALGGQPAELLEGSRVLEVRARGVHKGLAVALVRATSPPGARLLAAGDDRTDDDMFATLPFDGLACAVGEVPIRADIRLPDHQALRAFLDQLLRPEPPQPAAPTVP